MHTRLTVVNGARILNAFISSRNESILADTSRLSSDNLASLRVFITRDALA